MEDTEDLLTGIAMTESFKRWLSQPTMSVQEAGAILGIKPNAAYRARVAGDIPAIKVGGRYRVPTDLFRAKLGMPPLDGGSESSIAA